MLNEVLPNTMFTAMLMVVCGALIGTWGEYLAVEDLCEENGEVSLNFLYALIAVIACLITVSVEMVLWKDMWYLPLMVAISTALLTSTVVNLSRRWKARRHPPSAET